MKTGRFYTIQKTIVKLSTVDLLVMAVYTETIAGRPPTVSGDGYQED